MGKVCKRIPKEQVDYILKSAEPATKVAEQLGISATAVRRYRRNGGYSIVHLGDAGKCKSYVREVRRLNPDKQISTI